MRYAQTAKLVLIEIHRNKAINDKRESANECVDR